MHLRALVMTAVLAALLGATPTAAIATSTVAAPLCEPPSGCLLDRTWHLDPASTTVAAVAEHGVLRLTVRALLSGSGHSASLYDGCNGMGANLRLNPARTTMVFEYFSSTPRFCDDVSNDAENALARTLGHATVAYRVSDSMLVLSTVEGDLAFRSAS